MENNQWKSAEISVPFQDTVCQQLSKSPRWLKQQTTQRYMPTYGDSTKVQPMFSQHLPPIAMQPNPIGNIPGLLPVAAGCSRRWVMLGTTFRYNRILHFAVSSF